jgi:hypothetical protein
VVNGCRRSLLQAQRSATAWRKEAEMMELALIMLLFLLILRMT